MTEGELAELIVDVHVRNRFTKVDNDICSKFFSSWWTLQYRRINMLEINLHDDVRELVESKLAYRVETYKDYDMWEEISELCKSKSMPTMSIDDMVSIIVDMLIRGKYPNANRYVSDMFISAWRGNHCTDYQRYLLYENAFLLVESEFNKRKKEEDK